MSTIKERLYEFLESRNMKASVFERECGLGNGFCSKLGDNITEPPLIAIKSAFPELNIKWLKTGEGNMTISDNILEISKMQAEGNMLPMVKLMERFIELGDKNSQANLLNAEANKLNASNLERLISILEKKLL